MRAKLTGNLLPAAAEREAESILRSCVHCGFCNATCPTYQVLGDERDGPRGRIYLMKSLLEGEADGATAQIHLDRCLTCRSCETTCPSGVRYGRLLELVRPALETKLPRGMFDRLQRAVLRGIVPYTKRFGLLLKLGQRVRPLLPAAARKWVPLVAVARMWPPPRHARKMIALDGCVQQVVAPQINAAAARILDRHDLSLVQIAGTQCCGALPYHLGNEGEAQDFARKNIDAWWPALENGFEGIFSASTGCTAMLKEYGLLLADDPDYAAKARQIAELAQDASEVILLPQPDGGLESTARPLRLAFHSPCTMQHAMKIRNAVESRLRAAGHELTQVADSHLCCGSAGTFSLLQPTLASELLARKLKTLEAGQPELIATANIGCLMHLARGSSVPVRHWLEVLDSEDF